MGLHGALVKTIDAGNHWTVINTGVTSSSFAFLSEYFFNADTGYIAGGFIGGDGSMWETLDGGTTLTAVPVLTNFYIYSVHFTNADTGFAVGEAGTIMKTLDGSTVWDTLVTGTLNDLRGSFFTGPGTAYAVGALGTILKTSNGGGYNMGLNNLSARSDIVLYPNPSSELLTIETSSGMTYGQLSVTNVSGREVLAKQLTQPRVRLDISKLPAGVYFVRIVSDGDISEGKFIKQ